MTMQLRLMRNATGIPNHALSRPIAYAGITALESIAPGLNGGNIKHGREKWNGITALPAFNYFKRYYYPANLNAAMATINKVFFPNAKDVYNWAKTDGYKNGGAHGEGYSCI